jgi:DNA-binding PadR family transcriptional regulator
VPALNPTAASLLGFLYARPLTGWDLVAAVERSVGYFWNVTRSQVYRELKTLEAAGLLALGEAGPRDRTPYAITPAGRAAFDAWIARAPGPELLRFPVVLTVFFGDHVEPALLGQFLRATRAEHQAKLDEYERIHPEVTEEFPRATLDLGIAYERTVIAWIDGLPWTKGVKPKVPGIQRKDAETQRRKKTR